MGKFSDAMKKADPRLIEALCIYAHNWAIKNYYSSADCKKCGFVNAITLKDKSYKGAIRCKRCEEAIFI